MRLKLPIFLATTPYMKYVDRVDEAQMRLKRGHYRFSISNVYVDRVDEAQMRLKHYSSLENHLRDGHVDRVDEAQMRLKQSPTV